VTPEGQDSAGARPLRSPPLQENFPLDVRGVFRGVLTRFPLPPGGTLFFSRAFGIPMGEGGEEYFGLT